MPTIRRDRVTVSTDLTDPHEWWRLLVEEACTPLLSLTPDLSTRVQSSGFGLTLFSTAVQVYPSR
jgi:hypothetical protein